MMLRRDYPILEFDATHKAVINAADHHPRIAIPEHCVVCFFQDVIDGLVAEGRTRLLFEFRSEMGKHPVYEVTLGEAKVALVHPGVGAPLAAVCLEEVIALGCSKFIACGGAGVLDRNIQVGHIVVPRSAVRDEGTSYHYLAPSREVEAHEVGIRAVKRVLAAHEVPYLVAKTWTTDAYYRETANKIQLRRSEGCLTVEMECAAFFAVAQFRGVVFAQLLYAGDDLDSEAWDSRGWTERTSTREKLFWLAVESCLSIVDSEIEDGPRGI